jgi:Cu(I)/Ag(I) efflux system membrane fusion protein
VIRRLIPLAVIALLVGADAIAGFPASRRALIFLGFSAPPHEEKIWWCPMHPFYKVKRYGICPYCNMALEEYKGTPGDGEAVLVLTDQQIQQAGVRTEKVVRRSLVRELLTSGILEKNRERYWHIDVRFEGWVEELYINQEGESVRAGQPLAKIYSPQLYATQKEYLLVRDDPELRLAARRRLELLRIGEEEIRELEERGTPTDRLTIRSPYDGVVVHRAVKPGMKIPMDGHLADIADLRELWIFADVYDKELALVSVGQEARVQVDAFPGEAFQGRVDLIEPQVRPRTQTARVRIRVANDPVRLLPGLFARALLVHRTDPVLAVSEHAVIPTGRRDIVIEALGGGRFAARRITIGRRWLTEIDPTRDARGLAFFTGHGRYHELLDGLSDGDLVVTGGAFLLHAETQIRQLIDKMVPPEERAETEPPRSAWSGARLDAPVMAGGRAFADHEEHRRFEAEPELSWERRFPEARGAMARAFEQYFLLHATVVEGKRELASEYAEGLPGLADRMAAAVTENFAPEEAGRLLSIAGELTRAAEALRGARTPRELRGKFGQVTAALEAWVAAYGPPIERLHQFYCGMARDTVGSPTERWFQADAELRNPFGMPGCGSMEKSYRPRAAPAEPKHH